MGLLKSASSRKAVLFVGGVLLVSGSLFAVACGTDNGNADDNPLPTPDSSRSDGRANDGGTTDEDGSATNEDSGGPADCGVEVPFLPNNEQGFYCPFKDRDAGDGGRLPSTCSNNEICCSPNRNDAGQFPPSFCAASPGEDEAACGQQATTFNSTWQNGGTVWQCGDKRNCQGANSVCCLTTQAGLPANDKVNIGATIDPDYPKACGVLQAYKWGGTVCRQNACTAGTEIPMCSGDSDCPQGQKCTPFVITVGDRYFGYCR